MAAAAPPLKLAAATSSSNHATFWPYLSTNPACGRHSTTCGLHNTGASALVPECTSASISGTGELIQELLCSNTHVLLLFQLSLIWLTVSAEKPIITLHRKPTKHNMSKKKRINKTTKTLCYISPWDVEVIFIRKLINFKWKVKQKSYTFQIRFCQENTL